MNSITLTENVATRMRDDQEQLAAWMEVLQKELSPSSLKALNNKVQDKLAHVRSRPEYFEHLRQLDKDIANASSDAARISILDSEGLGRINVGTL